MCVTVFAFFTYLLTYSEEDSPSADSVAHALRFYYMASTRGSQAPPHLLGRRESQRTVAE